MISQTKPLKINYFLPFNLAVAEGLVTHNNILKIYRIIKYSKNIFNMFATC